MSFLSNSGLTAGGLLSFDGAQKFSTLAKQNEANRQGKINLGLGQIDAVFGGGTTPFYTLASGKYNPSAYYSYQNKQGAFAPYYAPKQPKGGIGAADPRLGIVPNDPRTTVGPNGGPPLAGSSQGSAVDSVLNFGQPGAGLQNLGDLLSGNFGGLFGSSSASPEDKRRKLFKKGQLYTTENKTFEGFQPEFFDQRYQDYINYALPQLGRQTDDATKSITYGLADRGLVKSSAGNKARSDLQYSTGQAEQQLADTGIAQKQQLQKDVEASKQQAIAQLYTTADPARATQGALAAASQLRGPSVFAPLGNMFGSLINQYYTNQLLSSYSPRSFVSTPGNDQYTLAGALPNVVNQGK